MISFVIPVYRSAKSLEELHKRIVDVFLTSEASFEILFIVDCGSDESWNVVEQLAAKDRKVRGLKMSRNYGQHNALLCGIREAKGEIIATLDDDLQHRPEEVPKLIEELYKGYDVIYAPPKKEQHGFLRNISSRITKIALQGAMGAECARHVSAMRVFRTNLRDAFTHYKSPTVNIDVLLTWGTSKFSAVRVEHDERKFGQSGYTIYKLSRHALNMMTGFSTRPLQLASFIGFAFSFFGFITLIFVLIRWMLEGSAVPGFAFLASIISVFSGAQLMALGIIGEYLALMHLRTMGKPPYFVLSKTD